MLPYVSAKHRLPDIFESLLTMKGSEMINEETRRKLRELSLEEMINALDLQDKDPNYLHLSFEDRMKMLVDYVHHEKYTEKVKRLLKSAHFRILNTDIHDMYYTDRNIDRT